jgi:hypothetical protein
MTYATLEAAIKDVVRDGGGHSGDIEEDFREFSRSLNCASPHVFEMLKVRYVASYVSIAENCGASRAEARQAAEEAVEKRFGNKPNGSDAKLGIFGIVSSPDAIEKFVGKGIFEASLEAWRQTHIVSLGGFGSGMPNNLGSLLPEHRKAMDRLRRPPVVEHKRPVRRILDKVKKALKG